ncbi:Golgi-specific brefeldin A-resistance guanine nucleotide exchange factor 1 [Dissostichus eleginoides]|uniref:Golgi-specific brefeldin A-resistance guanine nucleotide exchange factor 1 n=1 Tax=Dissostichus eleginoides TaxID=100907 RepID=A0AAD9FKX1_DISEL|nr:Golgi-specific brefeldin A-resistance guanine nucleotide exchange factor 1 [Dissostichus eleginoides]
MKELSDVEPNVFLRPFLEVVRSEDTTGPITGLALTSVNKFLSYGLIDANHEAAAEAIENMADAVTHARFVGTDPASDEVVLMKILQVLRTLLLTPVGAHLTNESVCEIMQSCFRICFEMRLSELLRKSAEHTLVDMVQLLFSRLPQFKEEAKSYVGANMKKNFSRSLMFFLERSGFFAALLDTRPSSKASLCVQMHSHLPAASPEQALHWWCPDPAAESTLGDGPGASWTYLEALNPSSQQLNPSP